MKVNHILVKKNPDSNLDNFAIFDTLSMHVFSEEKDYLQYPQDNLLYYRAIYLLNIETHKRIISHTMAYFYMIYRYVISEWRSISPVEINQYDITMATHYDITMGNDIARDAHCEITMGNAVARDIHCDITMCNDVAMCTYHGITMQNHITMNIFYYVFSVLCPIVLLYSG